MITETIIRAIFAEELAAATKLLPQSSWKHPFKALRLSNAKTIWGSANGLGTVTITRAFIGTDAEPHLRNTIRHELAHLIAGVRQNHNARWRKVAVALGCTGERGTRATNESLKERVKPPLALHAVLADGTDIRIKVSHKRSSKYTCYDSVRGGAYFSVRGKPVSHFYYTENK